MPDFKKLFSPKVIIPASGLIVLIIVATLVAIFYIRNPTVTDGLFNNKDETTTMAPVHVENIEHRLEAVTAGSSGPHLMSVVSSSSTVYPTVDHHDVTTTPTVPPTTVPRKGEKDRTTVTVTYRGASTIPPRRRTTVPKKDVTQKPSLGFHIITTTNPSETVLTTKHGKKKSVLARFQVYTEDIPKPKIYKSAIIKRTTIPSLVFPTTQTSLTKYSNTIRTTLKNSVKPTSRPRYYSKTDVSKHNTARSYDRQTTVTPVSHVTSKPSTTVRKNSKTNTVSLIFHGISHYLASNAVSRGVVLAKNIIL